MQVARLAINKISVCDVQLLNDAAENLSHAGSKWSHMTLHRKKKKLRRKATEEGAGKLTSAPFQIAIDGKKVHEKERFAVLAVHKGGSIFVAL